MLETLTDLPAGTIGFVAHGKLTVDDYKTVLEPALGAAYDAGDAKPHVLFVMDSDFDGIAAPAFWEDFRFGVSHLHGWGRIALVGEASWITHVSALAEHVIPGRLKTFPLSAREEALTWLVG
jgi:hypothetical protein